MTFNDGTTRDFDQLIGADGARSVTRRHILGAHDPEPSYLGLVDVAGFCRHARPVLPTARNA